MTTTKLKAARIEDGVVTGVILVPDEATAKKFKAVLCPDRCAPGWGYDGVDFVEPAPVDRFAGMTEEEKKAGLYDHAAMKRWQRQVGGTSIDLGSGPIPIPTDGQTQVLLAGARIKADADASYVIAKFKMGPGSYAPLNAAAIIAISDAVEAHIQGCFDLNDSVDADIGSGSITTTAEIDAAFAS